MLVSGALLLLGLLLATGRSRNGQPREVPGLALQKPERAPVEQPKQAEVIPTCDDRFPTGPARFKRDKQTGELRELLNRLGAGTEPFAVSIRNGFIAEQGKGTGARRYVLGAWESKYLDSGVDEVFQLGWKPPGSHTSEPDPSSVADGVGYVLSRTRRRYRPGEALVACEQAASIKQLPKVPVAAARLVAAGTVTTSWTVAVWMPRLCGYMLFRLQGSPARDALANRL